MTPSARSSSSATRGPAPAWTPSSCGRTGTGEVRRRPPSAPGTAPPTRSPLVREAMSTWPEAASWPGSRKPAARLLRSHGEPVRDLAAGPATGPDLDPGSDRSGRQLGHPEGHSHPAGRAVQRPHAGRREPRDSEAVGTGRPHGQRRRSRLITSSSKPEDPAGASCTGEVKVCVPLQSGGTCRDGGARIDSTTHAARVRKRSRGLGPRTRLTPLAGSGSFCPSQAPSE